MRQQPAKGDTGHIFVFEHVTVQIVCIASVVTAAKTVSDVFRSAIAHTVF